jgi:hypothetical protein
MTPIQVLYRGETNDKFTMILLTNLEQIVWVYTEFLGFLTFSIDQRSTK